MYPQILPPIRRPIVAAALASALLTAGASEAELLSYEGTAEITATEMPGEIDVGDLFDFTLTYDDASIDEEVSPFAGNFPTGLTAFTLTRRPSNTGTWDPAVGSFALPGRVQTQETQSRFRFQPGGTGFDTLNGSDFDIVDLLLQPVAINDTGLGQTIAEQLGGPLSGDLADFTDPSMNIFSVNFDRADGEVIAFVRDTGELDILRVDQTGSVISYANIDDFITNQNGTALGPPVSAFATARGFFSVADKFYAVLADGTMVQYLTALDFANDSNGSVLDTVPEYETDVGYLGAAPIPIFPAPALSDSGRAALTAFLIGAAGFALARKRRAG